MQGSWLGIGLMAVVVVACSIAGLTQSRTKVQMKATLCAVATLALVLGLFCCVVIALSQSWAAPVLAIAAAVGPLSVYCAAMVAWGGAEPPAGPVSRQTARRASVASELKASSGRLPYPAIAIERASSDRAERPAVFVPIETGSRSIEGEGSWEEVENEAEEEISVVRAPMKVHEPAAEAVPAPEPESEPALVAEAAPTPVVEPGHVTELVPTPALEHESEPVPLAEPAFSPEAEPGPAAEAVHASVAGPESELAHKPSPEAAPKPALQLVGAPPSAFDAARYFERAAALRDKGLHVAASRLYAECAKLADDRATSRKASLEEIACYVRAGSLEHARELAARLLASTQDLTPVEKIKLDAVLKAA